MSSFIVEHGVLVEAEQSPMRYDVFLSHPGQDKDMCILAELVRKELENRALQQSMSLSVFVDSESLPREIGTDFTRRIDDAVCNCSIFVCFLADEYFRSYWCMRELDIALDQWNRQSDEANRDNRYLAIPIQKIGYSIPNLRDSWFKAKIAKKQRGIDKTEITAQLNRWKNHMKNTLPILQGGLVEYDSKGPRRTFVDRISTDIISSLEELRQLGPSRQWKQMSDRLNLAYHGSAPEKGPECPKKYLLALLAVIVALVVLIGGICGSGVCSGGSHNTTDMSTQHPAPTRPTPQPDLPPHTARPTESLRGDIIRDAANQITLSGQTLRYPLPSDPTPEETALAWLIDDDPAKLSATTELSLAQRQRFALASLWFQSTIPLQCFQCDFSDWLVEVDECDWNNVDCDVHGQVLRLNLGFDNVHGLIPSDLGLLTSMRELKLHNNKLAGNIPTALGLLNGLRGLSVSDNPGLVGQIPTEVTNLSNLESGYFYNTGLTGTMPFCEMNKLFSEMIADCNEVDCPCCTSCCPTAVNGIPVADFC